MTTTGPVRATRWPRDVRARERLREAQQQEAAAVAAVCAANQALDKACAKRDAALAAAAAVVERTRESVAAAQTSLVRVSGVERSALLLGLDPAELRKIITSARNGRTVQQ